MAQKSVAAVILAAGRGSRMKSATPKVLHEIGGRPLIGHALAAVAALGPERLAVVISSNGAAIEKAARSITPEIAIAVQDPPRGTGDAVRQAMPAFDGFDGVVLVHYADTPLVRTETLALLVEAISGGAAVAALGFYAANPGAYGRLKRDAQGRLVAIVEANDATPEELEIDLVNSGVMAFDAAYLRAALPRLTTNNAKGEYYLTDMVALAVGDGRGCAVAEATEDEVVGVNSQLELAVAEEIFQDRRRMSVLDQGVTLIDPSTTYFAADTEIAGGVVIEPGVFFGPGVRVASGARIKAFSHIEGADIGPGAQIGPFARLRPGARIGEGARIGNFVEVKNATIGVDAKVNHLSYIGDAGVGDRANIGAGAITCNFDGYSKYRTEIGADAFVGSNSALVAPLSIGAGAYVGSGSVITRDVEANALAVARGRQTDLKGWAQRFRVSRGVKLGVDEKKPARDKS